MKYLPYENYHLKTKLTPYQINLRLNENIEPKKYFRFGSAYQPYEGSITSNIFRINRIIGYGNSFLPRIYGVTEKDYSGSNIHIKMFMHPFVIAFLIIWFGGVTFAGIAFTIQQIIKGGFNPAILFIIMMFALVYGLTMGAFKYESKKSKLFLTNLFEAEEIKSEQ